MKVQTMKNWIVKIRCHDRQVMWSGNFTAPGRNEAKREARMHVSKYFPDDTKIVAIAEGFLNVTLKSEPIPFEEIADEEHA